MSFDAVADAVVNDVGVVSFDAVADAVITDVGVVSFDAVADAVVDEIDDGDFSASTGNVKTHCGLNVVDADAAGKGDVTTFGGTLKADPTLGKRLNNGRNCTIQPTMRTRKSRGKYPFMNQFRISLVLNGPWTTCERSI